MTLKQPPQETPQTPQEPGAAGALGVPGASGAADHTGQQWREEFPYRWDTDDLVTRRDTIRFLLAGTGALFVATSALAVIGEVSSAVSGKKVAIARVDEFPENAVKVFDYPDGYAQGILVNLPGKGLVAYSDVCTHLSCAVLYEADKRQFHCPCHEGYYDAATGDAIAGPPIRPLPIIKLAIENGVIYAVQEEVR